MDRQWRKVLESAFEVLKSETFGKKIPTACIFERDVCAGLRAYVLYI